MSEPALSPSAQTGSALVITRTYDAPRELVWKAWTDPEQLKRWWGPRVFSTPSFTVDLRPGGAFHYSMRSPDGTEFRGKGVYREIVPPERLVYDTMFADAEGNTVPASYYGMGDDWPETTLVTVTLEEQDGTTILTLRNDGIPTGMGHTLAEAGWKEALESLARELTAS